jgi:hypothetical protein
MLSHELDFDNYCFNRRFLSRRDQWSSYVAMRTTGTCALVANSR